MVGFFRAKSVLDPEVEAWHIEAWSWLLRNLGGVEDLKLSPLVRPSREWFPVSQPGGHALAREYFDIIRRHANLEHLNPDFRPKGGDPGQLSLGSIATLRPLQARAAGVYSRQGNAAAITYAPNLLSDFRGLVATLAHELAHMMLDGVAEPRPPGDDAEELLTDIAVIYLGFGIFGAQTAFRFGQFQSVESQGWQTSRLGYLTEAEWAFGLSVFLALTGRGVADVSPWVKPEIAAKVKRSMAYLNAKPNIVQQWRAIEPRPQ